jgi:hypothetical protein
MCNPRAQHLKRGALAAFMHLCHWLKEHPQLLSVILIMDEFPLPEIGVNNMRKRTTTCDGGKLLPEEIVRERKAQFAR